MPAEGAPDGRLADPMSEQPLVDMVEDPFEPVELLEPVAELPLVLVEPVLELVLAVLVAALAITAPPVTRPVVNAPMATTLRRRRIFMIVAPSDWCHVPLVWRNVATVRSGSVGLSR
jgi:hypothetical protein